MHDNIAQIVYDVLSHLLDKPLKLCPEIFPDTNIWTILGNFKIGVKLADWQAIM